MVSKKQELEAERHEKTRELRAISEEVVEGPEAREERNTRFDAKEAEIGLLSEEINRLARLDAVEREQVADAVVPAPKPLPGDTPAFDAEAGFESLGSFLQAVATNSRTGRPDARLDSFNAAATGLGETVPSDGGFFVQQDISGEILRRTYETGQIMSRVNRLPISTNANGIKINALDESSRVDGSRFGGIQTYWVAESDAIGSSKPKFRQVSLELNKCASLVYATDELLQDAAALQAIVLDMLPQEIAFKTEDAIMNGTGAGQPKGYLNSGAVVSVAKESSQPADTVVFENVLNMWSRMWAPSRRNAVWLINQDIEPQLYSMSLTVGSGGVPVYLPANGIAGAQFSTLFGRPVIPVEHAATLGDQGDIQLVDLSQYLLIEKGGIQTASSIHVRFVNDEQVFRFTYRVDGRSSWNSALTPKNGTNTQAPYVVVAERA